MEGTFNHNQFTPDLLLSDLIGSAIYEARGTASTSSWARIFGNFILADEINRAPANVQSALPEATEERQVSSGSEAYKLDEPFFVIATQNPIEHEGTWDLPQAQIDRFLLHVTVDYPDLQTERLIFDLAMAEATAAYAAGKSPSAIAKSALAIARQTVLDVHLSELVRHTTSSARLA